MGRKLTGKVDGCGKRVDLGAGEGERGMCVSHKLRVGASTDVSGEAWPHHTRPFMRSAGVGRSDHAVGSRQTLNQQHDSLEPLKPPE